MNRRVIRTSNAPMAPGFLGGNHQAAMRVSPEEFAKNDPFFVLMDDNLEAGDTFAPMGEAHPHAGFETVTLILEGALRDRHEGGTLEAGDLQWMTAGRGVIHSEDIESKGKLRILQLWLTLPKRERWTDPGFQEVRGRDLPVRRAPGVEVRLYSGSSGEVRSPTRNHVPVTLADIRLEPNASFEQDLPASYNGFLLVIEGTAQAGADGTVLRRNEVGWLDRSPESTLAETSTVRLVAGAQGARLVLYAGQPQGDPIVAHGPFIGDTQEDITRLFGEYRRGRFQRMSELAAKAPI